MLSGLAFHLAEAGAEVHVITSRQHYENAAARVPNHEAVRGVRVHRVWTSRFGRKRLRGRAIDYVSFNVSAFAMLAAIARRGDIVIAMTDPPLVSVSSAIATYLCGARLVNWLQDVFPEIAERVFIPLGIAGDFARLLRNFSLRRAAANVVLGEGMRRQLESVAKIGRVVTIHNWADGQLIVPVSAAGNTLRDEWGLRGKFVVAYSGNMGRAHDFDTILDAAERLREDTRIAFLFVGGGHHVFRIEGEVRERRLTSVVFQPYQPEERLAKSLGVADVHLVTLLPALEGLMVPSKIYGILAAGRPTLFVGDTKGEIATILASSRAGYAIDCGDSERLAQRLVDMANSPSMAASLGKNARQAFEAEYDRPLALCLWRSLLLQLDPAVFGGRPVSGSEVAAGTAP